MREPRQMGNDSVKQLMLEIQSSKAIQPVLFILSIMLYITLAHCSTCRNSAGHNYSMWVRLNTRYHVCV